MVELHALLTPKKPMPAYVIINQPQELPDCSEGAEAGQRVNVPEGLYTLLHGDRDNPNAAYKLVLYDADSFHSTGAGMALTEWEAAAEASGRAIEIG